MNKNEYLEHLRSTHRKSLRYFGDILEIPSVLLKELPISLLGGLPCAGSITRDKATMEYSGIVIAFNYSPERQGTELPQRLVSEGSITCAHESGHFIQSLKNPFLRLSDLALRVMPKNNNVRLGEIDILTDFGAEYLAALFIQQSNGLHNFYGKLEKGPENFPIEYRMAHELVLASNGQERIEIARRLTLANTIAETLHRPLIEYFSHLVEQNNKPKVYKPNLPSQNTIAGTG